MGRIKRTRVSWTDDSCVNNCPAPTLADATDEQIAAEQERREHEWTDEGWAEWRREVDGRFYLARLQDEKLEHQLSEIRGEASETRFNHDDRLIELEAGSVPVRVWRLIVTAIAVVALIFALTGCATHAQPDTGYWEDADAARQERQRVTEAIGSGSLRSLETKPSQAPPRTPGAIDVTGTPIWDAENGVWRQGGPCIEQPIRHADDVGVWG